ncbi:MAG: DUF4411 family protein [Gemmatimonadetes bacterium]|nr:DUF4411 family protein [Gemmatimonadota bacterium]
MRFSIDTSAILDGWTRYYPREAFPGLWQHLGELIESGHLRASEEVRYELAKKEDEALEWAERQDGLFVPIDDDIQDAVSAILSDHPRLIDTRRGRSGADPFVIALAKVWRCAVVTGERPSGSLKRPKIPDVCSALGVASMSLLDLIRQQGWVFR